MTIERKTVKGIATLSFSGELTIYTVSQLYQLLFDGYEALPAQVELDLSAVSEIDTAGIQLLLFSKKSFAEANKTLFVVRANELIDNVFSMLDVTSILSKET